ncbi:ATP-binding protein [Acidisoma sp. S159]|uniref:ATP-binding protein n=1 Tax=Acidisoma sp. S159 TaxID=1747225 RepID=UPI00131D8714|nr:ATP-binding protein [Acidisoma sp. S159]
MPLFEAVHNALHAVDDRYKERAGAEGRIKVTILREDFAEERSEVAGFIIEDNGIGLDEENFRSFLRPDSRHKIVRGGKGTGRLGWLKVFSVIEVDSTYDSLDGPVKRSFDFRLTDDEQVRVCEPRPACPSPRGTCVSLKDFKTAFLHKCPTDPDTILQKLASHFLLYVVADNPVSISIEDGSKVINLATYYGEHIGASNLDEVDIKLDFEDAPQTFVIRHLKVSKRLRTGKGYNRMLLFGNDRAADESSLDQTLGLTLLDKDQVYVGCASSPYLDRHVNSERTGLTLSSDELSVIRRQLIPLVTGFLQEQVDKVLDEKRTTTVGLLNSYPQFLFIRDEMDDFVKKLKPGSGSAEDVFLEMARARFRRQGRINRLGAEISKQGAMSSDIEASIDAYRGMISVDQKGVLAEYVLRRKAVLDLFGHLREFEDAEAEKPHREAALHSLICPMGNDSTKMEFDDHNLWMVDDRLAFFAYFSSDRRLKSYVDINKKERPDITFFYDTCFAWRGEGEASNTVVLVEFKRPNRNDYNGNDNPVRQIGDYVDYLRTSNSVTDSRGRSSPARLKGAAYHCYIVADLTDTLLREIRDFSLKTTPDGEGRFGYISGEAAYVEIIPYEKLLRDAKLRQGIFFQKLGLTDLDPDPLRHAEIPDVVDQMAEEAIEYND